MKALTTGQVVALTTNEAAALNSAQVAALSTNAIAALETADLGAIKTAVISALSSAQVAALTDDPDREMLLLSAATETHPESPVLLMRQRLEHRRVQSRDDVLRRVLRRPQSVPERGEEAGQSRLVGGGNIR